MKKNDTFNQLLERAKAGDREAADELVVLYSEKVLQIIRAKLGGKLRNKVESMDLFQTAMKSAFRGLDRFNGDSPKEFLKWITTILSNDIRDKADFFSQEKRDQARETPMAQARKNKTSPDLDFYSQDPTPSQNMMTTEREALMEEAVLSLPADLRKVVLLRMSGRTLQEIAGSLDMGERTVSRHYANGLEAIRKFLNEKGYEGV